MDLNVILVQIESICITYCTPLTILYDKEVETIAACVRMMYKNGDKLFDPTITR